MENAKQEKKVGVGEVVLNSLADHMKHNLKPFRKILRPNESFTQSHVSNGSAIFLYTRMPGFNILFMVGSNKV